MVSDRVMAAVVVFEEDVLRLICGYAPPSEGNLEEKQSFNDELKGELDVYTVGDIIVCLGDIIKLTGRHIDEFDHVHGEYGVDQRNLNGKMFLESCLE